MALSFLRLLQTRQLGQSAATVPETTGTYVSVATAGNTTINNVESVQYPTNWKEQAPSYGVYGGGYVTFVIEQSSFSASSVTPKPRDTYTPSGSSAFTVLAAMYVSPRMFWVIETVNLAIANGLKDTVNLQHPTITSDAAAGRSESWSNVRTSISCRVQPDDTLPFDGRGMRAAERRYLVYLDPSTGSGSTFAVTNSAGDFGRLVFGSINLQIEHYREAERIDELPVATCRRLP